MKVYEHGSISGGNKCKCEVCRRARADYRRSKRTAPAPIIPSLPIQTDVGNLPKGCKYCYDTGMDKIDSNNIDRVVKFIQQVIAEQEHNKRYDSYGVPLF